MIIFVFSFKNRNIGQGVIGDPEPVGESIGDHNINGVVASSKQQEYDPTYAG